MDGTAASSGSSSRGASTLTLAKFADLLFGYGTLPCMLLQCTFRQVVARQGSSAGILLD